MRAEFLTIFPEYFSSLELSLIGKARRRGTLHTVVCDLRDYDPGRRVDDTPYGGGPGMVMTPEPWAQALTRRFDDDPTPPILIFPSPSGHLFNQRLAQQLAEKPRLIFACGRYEGIDQRVYDWGESELSRRHGRSAQLLTLSLGDYVLCGGEVAALAIFEAVSRLLPGVVGNPESLREESHSLLGSPGAAVGGLEYPTYTKPARWRGLPVPEVLLSGNHKAISAWRAEHSRERTARIRPDLLPE